MDGSLSRGGRRGYNGYVARGDEGGSAMTIGRLFGIEIRASRSWIFVLMMVTLTMASQFERSHPDWGRATTFTAGAVASALFFASVLIHELSHCLVARRFGIRARSITLNFF